MKFYYIFSFSKTCCVYVDVFSVWKSKQFNVWKAKRRRTKHCCLVFKWIVTQTILNSFCFFLYRLYPARVAITVPAFLASNCVSTATWQQSNLKKDSAVQWVTAAHILIATFLGRCWLKARTRLKTWTGTRSVSEWPWALLRCTRAQDVSTCTLQKMTRLRWAKVEWRNSSVSWLLNYKTMAMARICSWTKL